MIYQQLWVVWKTLDSSDWMVEGPFTEGLAWAVWKARGHAHMSFLVDSMELAQAVMHRVPDSALRATVISETVDDRVVNELARKLREKGLLRAM